MLASVVIFDRILGQKERKEKMASINFGENIRMHYENRGKYEKVALVLV